MKQTLLSVFCVFSFNPVTHAIWQLASDSPHWSNVCCPFSCACNCQSPNSISFFFFPSSFIFVSSSSCIAECDFIVPIHFFAYNHHQLYVLAMIERHTLFFLEQKFPLSHWNGREELSCRTENRSNYKLIERVPCRSFQRSIACNYQPPNFVSSFSPPHSYSSLLLHV